MNTEHESIGLIGVGLLGTAIAERFLSRDHRVFGHDLCRNRLDALLAQGGHRCESASEVFGSCSVVVMSLPHSNISMKVLSDCASSLRSGQTIIDTTTGNPEEMVEISQALQKRGVTHIEANVAGSSQQVRTGDACLFVGGEADDVEQAQGLLDTIAPKHFHLGPVGCASRFKLVHNLILGLNRAVLAEGLSFSEAFGFEPARVLEILQQTPAASMVMQSKGPKMVSGDFAPQARLSQHLKDVRLIVAAAEQSGAPTPLSQTHQSLLEKAESLGYGDADNSAVIEAYRKRPEETV